MRIEKIELIGFKSFADKTSFTLHPGITCIIGPNGCGKSNIVDAFRWVLGEQSAKSLRGEKMEEVIFNGSSLKKPKGMAEVSMVISGLNGSAGNGQTPGDITTVSRRLYRSGESEYMINKSSCRLRDVKDIFLDTGLDFRSYSILEQGRIGEIVNSKPYERRFIIEEVAGVMKYKLRKAEALSKLESSRANLLRINDIVTEVKKQINILDRLAKKAERYKRLSSEMHAIELKIARREFQQIKESLDGILSEYDGLKEKEAVLSTALSDRENKTETRRLELIEKEKVLEGIQKTYQIMEREIFDIERSIAVGRNDVANLGAYGKKLLSQEEEMDAKTAEIAVKLEELKSSSKKISAELEELAGVLREKTESFRTVEEELSEKEERIEDARRGIFRISEELSNLRNELGRRQTSYEALERREDAAQRESEDSRKMLARIEASINDVGLGILGINNEIRLLEEKKEVLLRELFGGKARLEVISKAFSEAREDLASQLSRLDSLQEIVFDAPTKELIASNAGVRLLASLSDVIEVEKDYEKAVESALAEKADSFILESAEEIEKAVSSLKGKDVGKTAFIAKQAPFILSPKDMPDEGIGRALDFVRVKEGYENIAKNLLGNILIVKDAKTAFSLWVINRGFTLVTQEGDVVEPSGAVIIGEGKGIFRRKREIRELEETIALKKNDIENLTGEMQTLQKSLADKDEAVRLVESSLNNLEKEVSLLRLTADNYTEEKERMSRKLAYLTLEIDEVSREKGSLMTIVSESEKEIQSSEATKVEIESKTSELMEEISRKKSEIEEYRSEVTDLRLTAASNRERLEAMKNEIESSVKILAELGQKKSELNAERESVLTRMSSRESENSAEEERLRKLVSEADAVHLDMSQKREDNEKENEDLIVVEHGLKMLRQQITSMVSRLSELDVLKAEHKLRLENLCDNVRNIYGTELPDIEITEVAVEEEERLSELRSKIQEMGPVNLGTLEEYEELRTRYEFMTKQQEDLTRSIAELEEAISKINSTTRKKLREAFETLNAKFAEVFVTLFGGGRAELILTDENNILESGIDIIVQPPGKKLQNIHLLSGGEKALTALSIQFASFLIKPTPLCILDEADAPLDESNTERYSKMLEELSKETQFIVVTHNRTTMSVAQHLYGITMEEAGVSKVISMQLADMETGS
jgi:chromosome segregation protein